MAEDARRVSERWERRTFHTVRIPLTEGLLILAAASLASGGRKHGSFSHAVRMLLLECQLPEPLFSHLLSLFPQIQGDHGWD